MNDQPPKDEADDLADLLAALEEVTRKEETGEMSPVENSASDDDEPDEDEALDDDDEPADEFSSDDEVPDEKRGIARADMSSRFEDSGEMLRPTAPRQTGPAIRATPPLPTRPTPVAPDTPTFRYRVSVVLSPELELQLNAARQSVSIPVARPGIFALQEDFESSDIEAVQTAIREWVAEYLPLEVEVERVVAEVIDAQRYVAGFALEPAQKINAAQQALAASLENRARAVGEDPLPFAPRLPVCDHTPAADFPRLVHELQKRFEASQWVIREVELLRVPDDDERWEVVQKF